MPKREDVSISVIRRLPRYYRHLNDLYQAGTERISSSALGASLGLTASQIRQDLSCFGEFGQQGYGYNVASLRGEVADILGINRGHTAVILGVGNLGRALLHYGEFKARGFHIVGAFDCDPFKLGEQVYGLEVFCTSTLKAAVQEKNIEIGVITTPPERAQRAADHLIDAGIKGILNFAPARIVVPDDVHVEYVDFFHYIYALAFDISTTENR